MEGPGSQSKGQKKHHNPGVLLSVASILCVHAGFPKQAVNATRAGTVLCSAVTGFQKVLAVVDQDNEWSTHDGFMALQRAFLRGRRSWSYECREVQGRFVQGWGTVA